MELVIQVQRQEELSVALEAGAEGVAVPLPRALASPDWPALGESRAAARRRGVQFYLTWDWLVSEPELPGARELLAGVAALDPDGLALRDLGLCQEARQRYPQLRLQAPGNWSTLNSPALRLAEQLGYRRVVVEAPLGLKDLALMRRQSSLPLEVALSPSCQGFPALWLLPEYLGRDGTLAGRAPGSGASPGGDLLAALAALAGLAPLGVEAVRLRADLVPPEALPQALDLLKTVREASPTERPRVVAAARDIIAAFGARFQPPASQERPVVAAPVSQTSPRRAAPSRSQKALRSRHLWLETRGYPEAAALARQWRNPLIMQLTPENYAAFLAEHRRWETRRLVWRLPPIIRETALSFYQQALETLRQGGYRRFVAGDWGAVALVRGAGGEVILGDQTLGLRNSLAVQAARRLGVSQVCLPPGRAPADWQELLAHAGAENFWSYLFQVPALAVFPPQPRTAPPAAIAGERLRWVPEGEALLLCKRLPEDLTAWGPWLQQHGVTLLVVSLPRSGLPRGQLPGWLPAPEGRRHRER